MIETSLPGPCGSLHLLYGTLGMGRSGRVIDSHFSLIARLWCEQSLYALITEANVQSVFLIHPLRAFPKVSPKLFSCDARYSTDQLLTCPLIPHICVHCHHLTLSCPKRNYFQQFIQHFSFSFVFLKNRGDVWTVETALTFCPSPDDQ